MRKLKQRTSGLQRKSKRNLADAEIKLWFALRARKLGGFKFNQQAKIGRYIVDFVCREKYLVVEVDGGQHAENPQDRVRDLVLASKGYYVLRFWNSDVLKNIDGVSQKLYEALCAR